MTDQTDKDYHPNSKEVMRAIKDLREEAVVYDPRKNLKGRHTYDIIEGLRRNYRNN